MTVLPPAATKASRKGKHRGADGGGRSAAIFLVPFFVLFALVMAAPMVYAVINSLFAIKRDGLGFGGATQTFVGLENYARVFSNPSFLQGFGRIGLYILGYVPLMIGAALLFALLLDATVARAKRLFQVLLFMPHAVPGVIAALIWAYLYTPGLSPIVKAAAAGGIELQFFSAHMAIPAIINIGVWEWTGYNVVIFFAALQAVSGEVLEAARIDGAGELRTSISIKLPSILPSLYVVALFTIIGTLQLFTEPYILKNAGSAMPSTFVPNMWIYDTAFQQHNLNLAAAGSIVLAVVAAILALIVNRISEKVNEA